MSFAVPVFSSREIGEASTLSALDEACRRFGVFSIVDHGIAPEECAAVLDALDGFFARPIAEKSRFARSPENPWGYYDRELTKNQRDQKEIFDCGAPGDRFGATPWPTAPADFREVMVRHWQRCDALGRRILEALAAALGTPADRLAGALAPDAGSFLRLNHYPTEPVAGAGDAAGLGVHPHTDAGVLTVLLQDDHAGLELRHEGAWHLVEPRPGALVVNLGDVLQVWSNDRWPAPLHRVRASR